MTFVPRYYGWKRQPVDDRDLVFAVAQTVMKALPASVDLSPKMGPQLDQEDLGCCGPNSVDECIEYAEIAAGKPPTSASRLFIYYVTRSLMGTIKEDSGVDNRTLLKALNKFGYCPESMWPYNTAKFTAKPPTNVYRTALQHVIKNYAAVPQDLNHMKGTLAMGHPFIFGFECFPGLESDEAAKTGIVPDPLPDESMIGGHDVTICGYDDHTQRFKFRNHWVMQDGRPWGDNGYGYISYKYATDPHLANDFWVINAL